MSAHHAPGPWLVHQGLDYIVVLRPDDGTENGTQVDNIKDARLIAAAPQLLLAAIRARAALSVLLDVPLEQVLEHPTYVALDAAIVEATRSTPS